MLPGCCHFHPCFRVQFRVSTSTPWARRIVARHLSAPRPGSLRLSTFGLSALQLSALVSAFMRPRSRFGRPRSRFQRPRLRFGLLACGPAPYGCAPCGPASDGSAPSAECPAALRLATLHPAVERSAARRLAALRPVAERPAARRLAARRLTARRPVAKRLAAPCAPCGHAACSSAHSIQLNFRGPAACGSALAAVHRLRALRLRALRPCGVRLMHPQLSALRPCGGRLCSLRLSAMRLGGLWLGWLAALRPAVERPAACASAHCGWTRLSRRPSVAHQDYTKTVSCLPRNRHQMSFRPAPTTSWSAHGRSTSTKRSFKHCMSASLSMMTTSS